MFAMASSSHLLSLSSSLLSSPSHSDVTLVTPTLSLQAHKSLLLSRLPSFSSLLCSSCSPHDPLLLLLPDTPASSLTSALRQLYTTGQPEQLAGLLGLDQGVKRELAENQDVQMDEKGWMEDDLDFKEKDDGHHDFVNFPGDVERNFENYKKKSFPQSIQRKIGSHLNRPGSDQRIINPVEICVDNRKRRHWYLSPLRRCQKGETKRRGCSTT